MQSDAWLLPKTTFPHLLSSSGIILPLCCSNPCPQYQTVLWAGSVCQADWAAAFLLAQFPVSWMSYSSSGISEHAAGPEWEQELLSAIIPEHFQLTQSSKVGVHVTPAEQSSWFVSIQMHLFCPNVAPLALKSAFLESSYPPVMDETPSSAWRGTGCLSLHLPLLSAGKDSIWPRPLGWFLSRAFTESWVPCSALALPGH